jgi:predicted TIM-barrel fold metal-dependent hydrolase
VVTNRATLPGALEEHPMTDLGFRAFDADHHYYEAEDAFTRHLDPRMRRRCMDWAEIRGRKRLLVAGRVNRFIPNPTFDPVAKPGSLDAFFRGKNPEGQSVAELFGQLEPINPAYRDRDARLALLDTQNIEGAMLFPTLGVGMQESLREDMPAACAAFRAFNRWLAEDWGFAYEDRLFAAPYISLSDPEWAAEEVEWCIENGARVVCSVPGPVPTANGPRSPAHPVNDPFWARVNDAGIAVAYHSGDAGYRRFTEVWSGDAEFRAFDFDPVLGCLSPEPIHDTFAALVCQGLFDRFPRLRVASIECGSEWVASLLRKLKKAYGQMPMKFKRDPVEAFREHISVAPYYEDDLPRLRERIGIDQILFGSDYPHAEGLEEPVEFVRDLEGYSAEEIRTVMRDNGLALVS